MDSSSQIPQNELPADLSATAQFNLTQSLGFIDKVKDAFKDQPEVYDQFIGLLKNYYVNGTDLPDLVNRMTELLAGHPALIQDFQAFLPEKKTDG